ncbi:zinc-ribbon domain-containing protein [[Eubacterium] cellulosolvens]
MGFREMMARANWELTVFLKTGKTPQQSNRQVFQPANYGANYPSYQSHQSAQVSPTQHMHGVPCPKCHSPVSTVAQFCHRCGEHMK